MICIDTMVLIWGVQGVSRSSQAEMVERTRRFIQQCDDVGEEIMVPSVVVSEYLSPFTPEQAARQLEEFHKRFFVAPLDAAAAALAASLTKKARGTRSGERNVLKSDSYIIATAIVHGAEAIVTGNLKEFRAIAGGRIRILDVPAVPKQLRFPEKQGDDE